MLIIENGYGFDDKVWSSTFGKDYQIVPRGTNNSGKSLLERRIETLKKYDTPKYLGHVGSLLAYRYSNIKKITQETVLVKKFVSRKGTEDEEITYNKQFNVNVIYFYSNENLMVLGDKLYSI